MFETKILKSGPEAFSPEGQFASTVNEGLSLQNKRLPSWLIFDNAGSELFKKITELAEYLPAACEFEIIHNHKNDISRLITGNTFNLIELGAGDGCKTKILIEHFLDKKLNFHYFPIDISNGAITNLVRSLENSHTSTPLKVTGLTGDYFEGLKTITRNDSKQNLVLFLGVTLNNMDSDTARSFLKNLKESLGPEDYLLTGFDLMKNPKLLYSAYNNGLFEKFNLHLLDRINQELGANFNKENFVQQGHYNPNTRAVESYLYSTQNQAVHIKALNKDFHFRAWEAMQTEQSFKYTLEEMETLALENGFEIVEHLFDSKKYFVDSVWKVAR
ncbi:MAG: L-histidine N(alpha)-methyltransferase [Nitrospinae bacterium]|nr:L-histidine N(alpha)-methyltransferase [Nitrospinota bacterium]MBL7020122.1 L-histidine N(alpha)-methyltransferase [Nitrospinaceae bacterium]